MNLRPYQKEAITELQKTIAQRSKIPSMVVHACGAGKTVLMSQITEYCRKLGLKVLNLTPREHLMGQIEKHLFEAGVPVVREQANRIAGLKEEYVLGSVMSMKGDRLYQRPSDAFDVVLADECHLAHGNNTYAKILDHFKDCTIIGFTATPHIEQTRKWKYIHEYSFPQGVEDGYLAEPEFVELPLSFSLKDIGKAAGDYKASDLETEMLAMLKQNAPIVSSIAAEIVGQTIVFTPGITSAQVIAAGLRALGYKAEEYHSKLGINERKKLREKMESGEVQVLVNPASLILGYDLGNIETIVIGRATTSYALLMQMIGRGTRMKGKKAGKFRIIEFEKDAAAKDLMTARDVIFDPKVPKKVRDAIHAFLKKHQKDKQAMAAFRVYKELMQRNMLDYMLGLVPGLDKPMLNLENVLDWLDARSKGNAQSEMLRNQLATPNQIEGIGKWQIHCPKGVRTTMGDASDFYTAMAVDLKKKQFNIHRKMAFETDRIMKEVILPELDDMADNTKAS